MKVITNVSVQFQALQTTYFQVVGKLSGNLHWKNIAPVGHISVSSIILYIGFNG